MHLTSSRTRKYATGHSTLIARRCILPASSPTFSQHRCLHTALTQRATRLRDHLHADHLFIMSDLFKSLTSVSPYKIPCFAILQHSISARIRVLYMDAARTEYKDLLDTTAFRSASNTLQFMCLLCVIITPTSSSCHGFNMAGMTKMYDSRSSMIRDLFRFDPYSRQLWRTRQDNEQPRLSSTHNVL